MAARRRNRNESPSALTVEVEYGATEVAADKPSGAHESVSNLPEVRAISTEPERHERLVEILAEAVYGYLKRRSRLAARAGHMGRNTPEDGLGSGGKILDESLDFHAQPTGTYDGFENG